MTERMTPDEFHAAQGVEDWRVLGEGAHAFYRTGSFAESARFIDVIAGLPGLDDQQPDIDIRRDGVTVRLITGTDDYRGMTQRDLAMARRISGVAREMGSRRSDRGPDLLVVREPLRVEVVRFWQALLGYERRADSPDDDLVDPLDRNVPFWFEMMDEPRADGGGAIHVGCHPSRPRRAWPRRWPRVAGSSETSSRPRGGRSRMQPGTRPTSRRRRGATRRCQPRSASMSARIASGFVAGL